MVWRYFLVENKRNLSYEHCEILHGKLWVIRSDIDRHLTLINEIGGQTILSSDELDCHSSSGVLLLLLCARLSETLVGVRSMVLNENSEFKPVVSLERDELRLAIPAPDVLHMYSPPHDQTRLWD